MSNITLTPQAPFVGSILSWPVDRGIRRAFYTDKLDASDRIAEEQSAVPDIATEQKQPRLGDNSIVEVLQKVLQQQESGKVEKTMPSNLDYRK